MSCPRLRLAAALVAAATLAACASSTTNGSGVAASPTGPSSSRSGPDFPSSSTGAGSTAPGSGSATPSPSTKVIPPPSTPLETHTVHADTRTYVVKVWVRRHDADCVSHAHGTPIVNFLKAHPCTGLDRLLATTTVGGRPVGYAESSTGFTGTANDPYATTEAFRKLELADNTGSLNDLLSEGYRLPSGPTAVPANEAFGVIGQDNGVAVWDLWYLDGSTPPQDKALLQAITDLYLQF